jgi:hypothetical protein
MIAKCKLTQEDDSPKANQNRYRSMIGGIIYLIQTRPNIMNAMCMVSIFQWIQNNLM